MQTIISSNGSRTRVTEALLRMSLKTLPMKIGIFQIPGNLKIFTMEEQIYSKSHIFANVTLSVFPGLYEKTYSWLYLYNQLTEIVCLRHEYLFKPLSSFFSVEDLEGVRVVRLNPLVDPEILDPPLFFYSVRSFFKE